MKRYAAHDKYDQRNLVLHRWGRPTPAENITKTAPEALMDQKAFSKTYEAVWADMDPNRHMRHSVYNDYAAQTRIAMFEHYGLPIEEIAKMNLGPILFREETKFFKEIGLSEQITVSCSLMSMRKDGSRWSFLHEIFKEHGNKAAQIIVEGAWLNLEKRKVATPPTKLLEVLKQFPRTESFEWQSRT